MDRLAAQDLHPLLDAELWSQLSSAVLEERGVSMISEEHERILDAGIEITSSGI